MDKLCWQRNSFFFDYKMIYQPLLNKTPLNFFLNFVWEVGALEKDLSATITKPDPPNDLGWIFLSCVLSGLCIGSVYIWLSSVPEITDEKYGIAGDSNLYSDIAVYIFVFWHYQEWLGGYLYFYKNCFDHILYIQMSIFNLINSIYLKKKIDDSISKMTRIFANILIFWSGQERPEGHPNFYKNFWQSQE